MITVRPIDEKFKLVIEAEGEKVIFTYSQLTYKIKNFIAGMVTSHKGGQIFVDQGLSAFYHIKYALKEVEGIFNSDGSKYVLKFESDKKEALTDACTDEILSLSFSDKLIYSAKTLINSVTSEILHPLTGQKLEGVEIVFDEASPVKKTS